MSERERVCVSEFVRVGMEIFINLFAQLQVRRLPLADSYKNIYIYLYVFLLAAGGRSFAH